MADGAYDDELTPEEEKILKEGEPATEATAADGLSDAVDTPASGEGDEVKVADPAPAEGDKPAEAAPAPAASEEDEFKAFQKSLEGKTPEEIERLAFNQQKRASKEAFQSRQRHEQLQKVAERAAAALEKTRANAADEREKLAQRLKDDPDAVTRELMEGRLTEAEEAAEVEAFNARVEAAEALAAAAIPDYVTVKPTLFEFGQEMGYSADELNEVADGRALVTLYLASKMATLIKSGITDTRGNFLKPIGAVNAQPKDPRLNAPDAVSTLSSAPARTPGGGSTLEEQLKNLLNMSDEDMAKMPEDKLDDLLRQASA